VLLKYLTRTIDPGIEQRDAAVKMGASRAIMRIQHIPR
jgi:hypothetical protein